MKAYNVMGYDFSIGDRDSSMAVPYIVSELNRDCYGINKIQFSPGDIVVDIGAHVGIFSMLMATKYKFLSVFAIEPNPESYGHLVENLEMNGITNVKCINMALTSDGRNIKLAVAKSNTGGSTSNLNFIASSSNPDHVYTDVKSMRPNDFLSEFGIDKIKMLKIDCEGGEYEILYGSSLLNISEYFGAEFHDNDYLSNHGYHSEELERYCLGIIDKKKMAITRINMCNA